MIFSNEILAPIGIKRETSPMSMLLQIMIILGIGMIPATVDKYSSGSYLFVFISFIFVVVPMIVFFIVKNREIILRSIKADMKPIIIMPMISNIGLAKKILSLYKVNDRITIKKLFLLKTVNFPVDKKLGSQIIDLLKGYGLDVEIVTVKHIDNPKELQMHINKIVKNINTIENCAINISSGKASTSVILYELAQRYDIEIHYIASKYDKENNPVDGTEQLTTLKNEYL